MVAAQVEVDDEAVARRAGLRDPFLAAEQLADRSPRLRRQLSDLHRRGGRHVDARLPPCRRVRAVIAQTAEGMLYPFLGQGAREAVMEDNMPSLQESGHLVIREILKSVSHTGRF